jgi:hypothetical protein
MKTKKLLGDLNPYVQGAIDNEYARERMLEGFEGFVGAFERARRRRVDPIKDRKLHRQVESSLDSMLEGMRALASGRDHPPRRTRRRLLLLAAAGVGGAAAAVGYRELQPSD